jgi:hypothetical protein
VHNYIKFYPEYSRIFNHLRKNIFQINHLNINSYMSQQVQQAAIGIDIGSWRSVIAVAKRGGVEVITN